ncbi:hypothetical protein MUK42_37089 [Musa troglodytarum]|uniref:Uncharacterized protein n=1 Tax=Musa troglodytarum TaxID=320322 RepID=A0A9E7JBS2_9LILI|nr:hypothetical protein MUK42_37089 [Musa troglodytarum]
MSDSPVSGLLIVIVTAIGYSALFYKSKPSDVGPRRSSTMTITAEHLTQARALSPACYQGWLRSVVCRSSHRVSTMSFSVAGYDWRQQKTSEKREEQRPESESKLEVLNNSMHSMLNCGRLNVLQKTNNLLHGWPLRRRVSCT